MPRIAGGKDLITQPLYDTQKYLLAGSAAPLTFFQTPKGQGASLFGAGPKNLADTNMRGAGMLPSPQTFDVHTVQVELIMTAASQVIDKALYLADAFLVWEIGSKNWLELPISQLPGGSGLTGFAATAVGGSPLTALNATNGMADPRAVFTLSQVITLLENENFFVSVTSPSAQALTADLRVRVLLGGEQARSIQ